MLLSGAVTGALAKLVIETILGTDGGGTKGETVKDNNWSTSKDGKAIETVIRKVNC